MVVTVVVVVEAVVVLAVVIVNDVCSLVAVSVFTLDTDVVEYPLSSDSGTSCRISVVALGTSVTSTEAIAVFSSLCSSRLWKSTWLFGLATVAG